MSFQVPSKNAFKDPLQLEALTGIETAINAISGLSGLNAAGVAASPTNSGSLTVVEANGIYDATMNDPAAERGEIYFLEFDTDPSFVTARPAYTGPLNYWRGALALGVNSYWRFYKQLQGSNVSPPINFGGLTPTAVGFTGAAGPTPGTRIAGPNGLNQPGGGIGPIGAK